MTIASQTSRISYTGDGSTTAFAVPFYFSANADLVVYLKDTGGNTALQVLGTNYNLSGAGVSSGGTCTFTAAPTTGYTISIYRDPPLTQTTSYNNNDPFPAKSHELALDKAVTIDQRTRDLVSRAVHLNDADPTATMLVPTVDIRKGKVSGYDAVDGSLTVSNNTLATLDSVLSGALATSGGLNRIVLTNTFADLKALTPFAGAVVFMQGYYSVGDGGGGTFIWNASSVATDDGGTIIQPNAGGVGRWARDFIGAVNVRWFGAKCDGVTDDTGAVQAAINSAQGSSYGLYVPGSCFISSSLNVTKALTVFGRSRREKTFAWTSGTLVLFNIVTDDQVTFRDLSFSGPVSASSGSVISLAGNTTHNLGAIVRDCTFFGGWTHFNTLSAAQWVVDSCYFIDPNKYGVVVQNTMYPDSGDSVITNCVFSSANANTVHILQVSSGGLKIIGNKFLTCLIAYNLVLTGTGTSTSDLMITGNSFEDATAAEISLTRPSGTQTFKNVTIVGNQISISPIGISTDNNASWLGGVTISGNQITSNSTTGSCISWGAGDNFYIGGNQFTGPGGGTCAGVSIGAAAANGLVGANQYVNLFVKVNNASSSVRVERPVPQSGNVAITCSTAWGALYRGTANIAFAVAYDGPPEVTCSPGTVTLNGAVAAYASSVTANGFTLNVISVTSGGSGQATWDASGVY